LDFQLIDSKASDPIKRSPTLWVSVIYFAEGFPYTVVNLMSVIYLKDLGASNELIGLTSLLYLPWVFKGVWGPVVDMYSTKRRWILSTEIICCLIFIALAFGALASNVIEVSIIIFSLIALVSATHDIAIDGFYLDALSTDEQALFVGVRSTAYKIAWLAGTGGLVVLAGYLADKYLVGFNRDGSKIFRDINLNFFGNSFLIHPVHFGWSMTFFLAALIFVLVYFFQLWYLPRPPRTFAPRLDQDPAVRFLQAFKTYFTQYRIGWIVFYILTFRLGDAFMLKMSQPFLMDPSARGGLGISTIEVGILYGTVGVIFLLAGGILGGIAIAKQGLKKWMWPMAIIQNSAILLYWLLAKFKPEISWVYAVNSFEQFSYGLGVAAYTVFLMRTVRPEYKASHYAITTAFMAAGVLIPGLVSGYVQTWIGYESYFLMSFFAAIPGLLAIYFLPLGSESGGKSSL
jgi:MFS transporter, PAT family, beta-lactamase induction signal transducer AmpG